MHYKCTLLTRLNAVTLAVRGSVIFTQVFHDRCRKRRLKIVLINQTGGGGGLLPKRGRYEMYTKSAYCR